MTPRAAAFLGFLVSGLVNAALIALRVPAMRQGRWLVHVFDLAAFAAFGLLAIGLVQIASVARLMRTRALLAAWAVSIVVGSLVLRDDLEHFSQTRGGPVPAWLILTACIALLAASVPASVATGMLLQKWAWLRVLGGVAAVAALVTNAWVLPADYPGIHFFIGGCAATLLGASLVGARFRWPDWFSRAWHAVPLSIRRAGASVLALGVLVVATLPPPSRVSVALARSDGSAFHLFLARLRARLFRSTTATGVNAGEWFRDRSKRPPIPPSQPPVVAGAPFVVLLTIDAVRAELINSGKYDGQLRALARLRKESIWFSRARAPATLTKQCLAAVFMGTHFSQQYWSAYEGRAAALAPFEDRSLRFPELLQRAGVRTLTFLSIPWLKNDVGVVRGFSEEIYVPYPTKKSRYTPAPEMFEQILPAVRAIDGRPTFLFTHLTDPHRPYSSGALKKGSAFDRYVSEIEMVDGYLEKLLQVLDQSGLRERTILIVASDHGEAFGEHNSQTHGITVYEEVLHVPLLVRLPTRTSRRVSVPVSLMDLGPTILDLMQVPTPGHYMAQSLVPFLRGETPTLSRPIIAETRLLRTLVTEENLKIILDTRKDSVELYDLSRDPKELDNLADSDRVKEPRAVLRQFFAVHEIRRPGYTPPLVR